MVVTQKLMGSLEFQVGKTEFIALMDTGYIKEDRAREVSDLSMYPSRYHYMYQVS